MAKRAIATDYGSDQNAISFADTPGTDYYSRNVSVFSKIIYDGTEKISKDYFYSQYQSGKTASDNCSILWEYVKNLPKEVTELEVWMDNCAAQNKCRVIIGFWNWIVFSERLEKVTLNYLKRGMYLFFIFSSI